MSYELEGRQPRPSPEELTRWSAESLRAMSQQWQAAELDGLGAKAPPQTAQSPERRLRRSLGKVLRRSSELPKWPIVSVVLTVHNQTRADLERTMRSVERQTLVGIEVVLVDDASTDVHTQRWLAENRDSSRVRLVALQENMGVCDARNIGAKAADGDLLLFLDPGDEIQPTYLEKAFLILSERQDVEVVLPDVEIVGDKSGIWITREQSALELMRSNGVPVASVHRSECFDRVGGFRAEMAEGFEDWDYWARIAASGATFCRLPEPLFRYVYSRTSGRDASARSLAARLEQRIVRSSLEVAGGPALRVSPRSPARHPVIRFPDFNPFVSERAPVVFFLPWFKRRGGADAYVQALCEEFVGQGRTVVVVTTLSQSDPESLVRLLGRVSYVYQLPVFDPLHWNSLVTGILDRLHGRALLVNVGSSWFADALVRGHLPVSPRDVIDVQFNHFGHMRSAVLLANAGCRTVSATEFTANLLAQAAPNSQAATIHAATPNIDRLARTARGRKADGSQPLTLGWIGRFSEEKNPRFFLDVIDRLEESRAIVVGAGDERIERELRAHPRVTLRSDVDDMAEVYDAIDLLCITSTIEGIPLIASEALACGVKVVSRSLPGLYELAREADGVYVMPSEDDSPGEFARTVRIAHETALRTRIALPESFTWESCANSWASLLEEMEYERAVAQPN